MKFVYPLINKVFDTDIESINSIVIENQKLLYDLIDDIYNQQNGNDGKSVVSENDTILPFGKNVELISQYFPFDLNKKTIISKITSFFEQSALDDINYEETIDILAKINSFLNRLSYDLSCDISFNKIDIGTIIKNSGIIIDSNESLCDKILDYFELVHKLDKEKMFFTVCLRSFVSDEEINLFMDTVLRRGYNLIMIESKEYPLISCEKRFIIDYSLCEIC